MVIRQLLIIGYCKYGNTGSVSMGLDAKLR